MPAYTVFSQSGGAALAADPTAYTMGMQFTLSQNAALTGIWFYSAAGAALLPEACCIYQVSGTSQVSGTVNTSPSWSGAAGSGWVKCTYDGSVTLLASTSYKTCVLSRADVGAGNWYSATANYWSSGAGSGGLTNGPLTAVNNAAGDGGQDTFTAATVLTYPSSSFSAGNYWIDVEVTVASGATTVTAYSMRLS